MRFQGKITSWNDAKGFGSITWHGSTEKLFVHISAFSSSVKRPSVGDIVTYEAEKGPDGKFRAVKVSFPKYERAPMKPRRAKGSSSFSGLIAGAFIAYLVVSALMGRTPLVVVAFYGAVSVVTFLAYLFDKAAAERGGWRTQESTLHLFSLAGGWPGAYAAQRILRHKTIKQPFQGVFFVTVVLNLTGFVIYSSAGGRALLGALVAAPQ